MHGNVVKTIYGVYIVLNYLADEDLTKIIMYPGNKSLQGTA
jgi:hypothetical protein